MGWVRLKPRFKLKLTHEMNVNLKNKKKSKKILRLNLSLVTVTNDKFFFFKMTSEFLFQDINLYVWNKPCYVYSISVLDRMSMADRILYHGLYIRYGPPRGHISELPTRLRMKTVLTSEDKKKVKIILRLNLSLVTVTNDKFFFF